MNRQAQLADSGQQTIDRPHEMADASYAITVSFELEAGGFAEFHRLVSENAAQSVLLEPGCIRFDVLTPLETSVPSEVLLYEIYTDRVAFGVHLASRHFKIFDEDSRRLVRKKTVVEFSVSQNAKGR